VTTRLVIIVAQQSVTKIVPLTIMNLVTPKVGDNHELLLNKPASGVANHLILKARNPDRAQDW
jgi:hypothetical protein